MLPSKIPVRSRSVRSFDLITPQGRTYRFPPPTLSQRLLRLLFAHAETVAISAAIPALIYVAGFAAEALDRSMFEACNDRVGVRRVG
ncbi:hypothetical protein ABIF63_001201 [Bradyrhizobium japonicum]|uniref:Uncharacterized protein n=1 Tax=Bradyrhizobium japonicum TaxID=375 RepID=A0ABV2RJJ1_BRAJP|nr:hypothetical protein [Bradyrhizobium japonicum]UQD99158.1 hypothetical protein JEY30_02395 [Bradyrhizobium japonicum]WLB19150.1 hypothetical protein QIH95_45820 [Bradyrhizobium japonicum]